MKRKIIFCSCLVLVCISVVASEQTSDDHHNENSTSMKTRDSKVADSPEDINGKNTAIPAENQRNKHATESNIRDVSISDYNRERGIDASYDSDSFERDNNLQDRGLFDIFIGDSGKRGKHHGRYPPSQFRGGQRRRGPSPYGQKPYRGQNYENFGGYGNQRQGDRYGYGGRYPSRDQYPGATDRYGQFSGRRGWRLGPGNLNYNGNFNGYPEEGYYGQSPYGSYSPYRDLPRSNVPVEPVLAR